MRCKTCKEKFDQYEFNNKFCKKIDCQTAKALFKLSLIKKQDSKDWKERQTKMKESIGYTTKKPPKNVLQDEINKLVRVIDNKFSHHCISCDTKSDTVQYAGGHRISVGACISIRYNLNDIHKQCNKRCNQQLSGNPDGYDEGLIKRYGLEYKNYVKYELRKKYNYIDLGGLDYAVKIALVRKLIRDFDTFQLKDGIQARKLFNKIIGIYK